jgi:hypothetical protein
MRISTLVPILLLATFATAGSTTWLVGPSRAQTKPSAVATLVHDGDTIAIDAGTYEADVARWSANNLVLKGVGGYAHLKANGTVYGGKAIWVIAGNNTTVDSIEFSLAACPDHNGAGIRQEGIGLTVRHCNFHDNEDGILAGDNPTSDITIEYSEFNHNGFGDGYSHNLYINHVHSLTFQYNYSHRAPAGHELKSRAYNNYILYNRLANESDGMASREIDLPNGGSAYIIGNEIEQGPHGENSNIVGYGLEGLTNPTTHQIHLINNTIVNDRGNGSFVNIQNGTALCRLTNNIFAGAGSVVVGTATTLDSSNNLTGGIGAMGFVDAAAYDYHLTAASPAVNKGLNAVLDTFLYPVEYMHPRAEGARALDGSLDIGAHEYAAASGVNAPRRENISLSIVPNPSASSARLVVSGLQGNASLLIYNELGEIVERREVHEPLVIDDLPSGLYHAILLEGGRTVASEKMIVAR